MSSTREACKQPPGMFAPEIDRHRCEGKEDCVRVCPTGVFAIRKLTAEERAEFSLVTRLKLWVHGNRQAFAVQASQCEACGLCVKACPERAIMLRRVQPLESVAKEM